MEKKPVSPYVSPYLQRPLRSLSDAMAARAAMDALIAHERGEVAAASGAETEGGGLASGA